MLLARFNLKNGPSEIVVGNLCGKICTCQGEQCVVVKLHTSFCSCPCIPAYIVTCAEHVLMLSVLVVTCDYVGFVSEVVFRPVTAPGECLLGDCEEIPELKDIDEEECPRDVPTTRERRQSLLTSSFYGRRYSLQTSDYYSVGMGTSPRQSISLSEEGIEADILEDVDAVMATEDEQSVGDVDSDAELDSQCESNLQSVGGNSHMLHTTHTCTRKHACTVHACVHVRVCACINGVWLFSIW